jgi:hypothetical protein
MTIDYWSYCICFLSNNEPGISSAIIVQFEGILLSRKSLPIGAEKNFLSEVLLSHAACQDPTRHAENMKSQRPTVVVTDGISTALKRASSLLALGGSEANAHFGKGPKSVPSRRSLHALLVAVESHHQCRNPDTGIHQGNT